ncbi:MAG: TonB-dependent receptor, partial [Porticoccaceae bacterium]
PAMSILFAAMAVQAQTDIPPTSSNLSAQTLVPDRSLVADGMATLPAVVVTATKQDTAPFETPAGVSVVGGQAVDDERLRSLSDIAQRMPNVYFTDFTHGTPHLTLRGLGFSDYQSDTASTGILIDGVPVYDLTLGTLFDIEQIEVLRGPQSTLYGQNSMGGLLAIRTRDADFRFAGNAQLDYGTGNFRRLSTAIDVPLAPDTAVRIAAGGEDADGDIKNLTLDRDDTGGWRSRFGRIKFLHRDAAGGEWRIGLHHVDKDGGNDFFAPAALARHHRADASDAGASDTTYTLLTGAYDRRLANGVKLAISLGGTHASWNYWLPQSLYGGPSGYNMKTDSYSAELRLAREPNDGDKFDWLAGAYASHLKKQAPYLFAVPGYFRSYTSADIEGSTAAVFGELGWRFAPRWRLAGALRIENDGRRMGWLSEQSGVYDSDGDGVPDAPYVTTDAIRNLKIHDTVLLPRLTLEFRPDPRQFAWFTLARGYKASGFNLFATDLPSASTPYAPEYGNYAELGYRLRGASNAWDAGIVGFYTQLRDQQVVTNTIENGGQSLVTNAGRSHNVGAELTASVRPGGTLEISGFAGYVKAVYDDYTNAGIQYDGRQFSYTPRRSYGLAVDWRPTARWNASLSVRHFSGSDPDPISTVHNPAYTLVDARITYRFSRWALSVYGKNVTDATYYTNALAGTTVVAAPGRTVGMGLTMDF